MTTKRAKVFQARANTVFEAGRLRVALVGGIISLILAGVAHGQVNQEEDTEAGPTSPQITEVQPVPPAAFRSAEAFWAEMNRRVGEWVQAVNPGEMSQQQIAQNVHALRGELREIGAVAQPDWARVREIMERRQALCAFLPESYELPTGEAPCREL